jgi:hypothetical protein
MRRISFFLVFGTMVLLGLFLLTPKSKQVPFTDLPWQIQVLPDGTSKVLGIHLGHDTLAAVVAREGDPDGLALFASAQGRRSLEAYFGTIRLGPLEGKLIVTLAAPETDLAALEKRAINSEPTGEGGHKFFLSDADKRAQAGRTVLGLTYIPSWSKMGADFLRVRFGPPTQVERVSATAERWLYPRKGLSLIVDTQGQEVFEYSAPGPPGNSRAGGSGTESVRH